MTINRLIKELQRIEAKHGKRVKVCADTQTLRETCNDVWQIVDLSNVEVDGILQVDGDGWRDVKRNGEERYRLCVILK